MIQKNLLKSLAISFFLFASPVIAEDKTNAPPLGTGNATTIKVQNGVVVKAAPQDDVPLGPESNKNGNVKSDFFKGSNFNDDTSSSTTSTPTPAPIEEKPKPVTVKMEPVKEEKKPVKAPVKTKKAKAVEKKPVIKTDEKAVDKTEAPSPFKKSQDANVVETVKKPDAKPEVKSQTLDDDSADTKTIEMVPVDEKDTVKPAEGDITKELEKIDSMPVKKSDKAAEDEPNEAKQSTSGLPIPRFVSLKSGEINARTGPGETYPIRWAYQRKNLPVEVTAEFKLWRRIKDFDGEQSWVHQAMLSSRRYAIVNTDASAVSKADGDNKVAEFKRGVQVKVDECTQTSCHVVYGKIEGWLAKKNIWGIYDKEVFD